MINAEMRTTVSGNSDNNNHTGKVIMIIIITILFYVAPFKISRVTFCLCVRVCVEGGDEGVYML